MSFDFQHPDQGQIDEYVFGRLGEEERAKLVSHLQSCPTCAAEKGWSEGLRRLSGTWESIQAPAGLKERILAEIGTCREQQSEDDQSFSALGETWRSIRAPAGLHAAVMEKITAQQTGRHGAWVQWKRWSMGGGLVALAAAATVLITIRLGEKSTLEAPSSVTSLPYRSRGIEMAPEAPALTISVDDPQEAKERLEEIVKRHGGTIVPAAQTADEMRLAVQISGDEGALLRDLGSAFGQALQSEKLHRDQEGKISIMLLRRRGDAPLGQVEPRQNLSR